MRQGMRKIIISEMISLDGFFAGPKGELDWHLPDEEFERFALEQLNEMDTILFGRITYEGMAAYWPTAVTSPAGVMNSADNIEFKVPTSPSEVHSEIAHKMNTLPKLIFSRTLDKVDWSNSKLLENVDREEISRIKQKPGKNMVIFGSADLISTLEGFDLIDEYRLFVSPVVLGSGKPLFKDRNKRRKLKLVGSKMFQSGVVGLFYQNPESKN